MPLPVRRKGARDVVTTMLRCKELACHFGGVRAVDGVDLALTKGECVGLVGANGSGKSTLLNVISGVLPPTAGCVEVRDAAVGSHTPEAFARAGLARTFQNLRLYEFATVFDNVALGLTAQARSILGIPLLSRRRVREAVGDVLARVGLEVPQWRRVGELSYGQQKRVELARVLIWRPEIVLLDEPTAGLVRGDVEDFADVIAGLGGSSSSLLLVEHDLDIVAAVCDRVIVLAEGRVVAAGGLDEVLRIPEIAATLGRRPPT